MTHDLSSLTPIEYQGMVILTDNRTEIWMTQKQIAELLGTTIQSVSRLISNAFKSEALLQNSTINILLKLEDGRDYPTNLYNLEAILIVGFRSHATEKTIKFRRWVAETVLQRYLRELEGQVETLKNTPADHSKVTAQLDEVITERDYYKTLAEYFEALYFHEHSHLIRTNAFFQKMPPEQRNRILKLISAETPSES